MPLLAPWRVRGATLTLYWAPWAKRVTMLGRYRCTVAPRPNGALLKIAELSSKVSAILPRRTFAQGAQLDQDRTKKFQKAHAILPRRTVAQGAQLDQDRTKKCQKPHAISPRRTFAQGALLDQDRAKKCQKSHIGWTKVSTDFRQRLRLDFTVN